MTATLIVYYYKSTTNQGRRYTAQLFSRKVKISQTREKYATTGPCRTSQSVEIHDIGMGSRSQSTELRHVD